MTILEREIYDLKDGLVKMGAFVEENVKQTFEAIKEKNMEILISVEKNENKTNEMESNLESSCLRILATLSPRAKDFRIVTGVLKIITDLERIGDHTEDISEICCTLDWEQMDFELPILEEMFKEVEKMLAISMDAFISGDVELIKEIDSLDDIIDNLYIKCREKIVKKIKDGVSSPELQLDLMQIAKYVERMGDHAENISEWVIYSNTGYHPSLGREEDF